MFSIIYYFLYYTSLKLFQLDLILIYFVVDNITFFFFFKMCYYYIQGWQFYLVPLNPTLPTSSHVDFSHPAKAVRRGLGKILTSHYRVGWGRV